MTLQWRKEVSSKRRKKENNFKHNIEFDNKMPSLLEENVEKINLFPSNVKSSQFRIFSGGQKCSLGDKRHCCTKNEVFILRFSSVNVTKYIH